MAAMKKAMKKAAAHAAPAAHPAMKKAKAMKAMKKWKMVQWSWSPKRLKTSWVEHFKHCETISGFWEVLQAFWCSPHLSTQKISSINNLFVGSRLSHNYASVLCATLEERVVLSWIFSKYDYGSFTCGLIWAFRVSSSDFTCVLTVRLSEQWLPWRRLWRRQLHMLHLRPTQPWRRQRPWRRWKSERWFNEAGRPSD